VYGAERKDVAEGWSKVPQDGLEDQPVKGTRTKDTWKVVSDGPYGERVVRRQTGFGDLRIWQPRKTNRSSDVGRRPKSLRKKIKSTLQ